MQILTETYHALDKIVFNFADEVFYQIYEDKDQIIAMLNRPNRNIVTFHKYLVFRSVYPKIEPLEITIHVFRNDQDTQNVRGGLSEDKQELFISSEIFQANLTDEYRSSIIHELNHIIYTRYPYFNYKFKPTSENRSLYNINKIEYMFNKSELTARNSQVSYYLHILNGKPVDVKTIDRITNLDSMKDVLNTILNDKYSSSTLSIVIGLNAIRNKTKKGNPSTLTLDEYYSYKRKTSEPTYMWLKSNTYKRMVKIYEQFNREINEKISRYQKEWGLT